MSKHRHTHNIDDLSPSERRAGVAAVLADGDRRMAKELPAETKPLSNC